MRRAVPRPTALAGAALAVALAGCLYAAAGAASDDDGDGGGGQPSGPGSVAVRPMAAAAVVDAGARPQAPALAGADLDGKPVGLAGFRGQVVVLNVWGSWCGPCRAEADDLERLSAQTRAQGVRFLGINTRDRDRAAAQSFVRAHGLGFPSLHDPSGELLLRFPPALLNPQTIPSTLVIDRRGRIAVSIGGAVTDEQLRPLVARVAQETS
ncbi:TlpA family protein disulfide reductase [Streptomyces sp. NBC_00335]|uniref:TlpA disulfide reductase family protein n=1 Tax=unclassified Streptomyces TaxID=2593676 RepID=UPI00225B1416|nr:MULTISPECIES: TlpA disulfide reductase family protein [unclassified Streptomyces]MCX5403001.1 TlpA family protein disulfide reductase [Streptomyces sp. NBC_00086]